MTKTRVRVASAVGVVLLASLLVAWSYFAVRVSTDDAQIDGHVNTVSARVGGTVTEVLVADNQFVEKRARRSCGSSPATTRSPWRGRRRTSPRTRAQARAAHTNVPMTSTMSTSQEAASASDPRAPRRARPATRGAREAAAKVTKSAQDPGAACRSGEGRGLAAGVRRGGPGAEAAHAARESADASVREAEKQVEAAKARLAQAKTGPEQVTIEKARADSAAAKAVARANLAQARLDLEHTEVKAAVSGIVSRSTVEVGQVVQSGQPLLAVVPLEDVWVVANYKENQLNRIRPGQAALVAVDAYGGRQYRGKVESIAAATGARFSILPPENASGNYVKVVQRVPVKIVLDPGQDPDHLLRPGMSVVPTILTR